MHLNKERAQSFCRLVNLGGGKVVKAEPLDEYVESKEDGCGSIMSDDGGHLTGFLEKVEKPDEKMVDRYYSPFGLTGEQGVRAKQGVKTERPSPVKGGAVLEERGDGAVSPPRSDIMSSVPHSLADAYPHLKYIPVPQAAAVQSLTAHCTGARRLSSSLGLVLAMPPTPSWPCLLLPQAHASPSSVNTTV